MKKNLFYYLFAVICSVTLFTACSDDDEDTTWQQIPEITNDNVTLTLNDKTPANATVAFDIINAESGKLTLKDAIYGHPTVDINVTLQKKDDTSYNFSGTANLDPARMAASNTALKVTVSGTVTTAGKVTVDVTTSGWAAVSGVYANDSVSVTVNGTAQSKKYGVTLNVTAANKATLTFSNIVSVANDFEMEVTWDNGKIEGSKEKEAGYVVTVTGNLAAEKLTLVVTTSGYKTLEKRYLGNNLDITYNKGESAELLDVELKNATAETAELKIDGVFLSQVDLPNGILVPVTLVEEKGNYAFEGKYSNKEFAFTATAKGSISAAGKMTLDFVYEITSDLVGKWSPKMGEQGAMAIFNYAGPAVTLPKELIGMLGNILPPNIPTTLDAATLNMVMNGVLAQYVPYLQSLTFKSNGYADMVVKKVGGGDVTTSMEDYIMYYVQGDQLFVFPNLSKLMGMSSMASANSVRAWDPSDLFMTGIPLTFDASQGTIKIETNVVKGIAAFAAGLLLPEDDSDGLLGLFIKDKVQLAQVKALVNWANTSLQASQTFEAGLILEKK